MFQDNKLNIDEKSDDVRCSFAKMVPPKNICRLVDYYATNIDKCDHFQGARAVFGLGGLGDFICFN